MSAEPPSPAKHLKSVAGTPIETGTSLRGRLHHLFPCLLRTWQTWEHSGLEMLVIRRRRSGKRAAVKRQSPRAGTQAVVAAVRVPRGAPSLLPWISVGEARGAMARSCDHQHRQFPFLPRLTTRDLRMRRITCGQCMLKRCSELNITKAPVVASALRLYPGATVRSAGPGRRLRFKTCHHLSCHITEPRQQNMLVTSAG